MEWMVDNPEKLKGLEGQTITLKAWTKSGGTKRNGKDTQENKMHVLEVKPARSMGRNADKK